MNVDNRSLRNLELETYVNCRQSDIISELYAPCLRNSDRYVRGAGYFRSSVYRLMTEEILDFCIRGGRITLITSPHISYDDYNAILKGHEENSFFGDLEYLLNQEKTIAPTKMLCALIQNGCLEINIALLRGDLYHHKQGYFEDKEGNIVAFDGSGNETLSALKPFDEGNAESFNIGWNWDKPLWNMYAKHWYNDLNSTLDPNSNSTFPVIKIEKLDPDFIVTHSINKDLESHREEARDRQREMIEKWDQVYSKDFFKSKVKSENTVSLPNSSAINPRVHQKIGLDIWSSHNYRGILEHATGSGKTVTAIIATEEHILSGGNVVILVPSEPLLDQWDEELEKFLPRIDRGLLGGGHKESGILDEMRISSSEGSILISTIQSFRQEKTLRKLDRLLNSKENSVLLIVDECHRIGSDSYTKICEKKFTKTLGLSATPVRQGDPEGTDRIFGLLGNIIHRYSLKDALDDGHLSPFSYHISTVHLDLDEQNRYDKLREEIKKVYASQSSKDEVSDYLKILIFKSRRIIRGARGKIDSTLSIVNSNYKIGQHWLIYCESEEMMDSIFQLIFSQTGVSPLKYWSKMNKFQRRTSLEYFEQNGGIMLAIKCLDEGVDIPAISHGIVLSSSKTEREWIQRRGRLLRKSKGKKESVIYDILALPNDFGKEITFVLDELIRARDFSSNCVNSKSVSYEISNLMRQYNIKQEAFAIIGEDSDD